MIEMTISSVYIFEVTVALESGFTWSRHIVGRPTSEKILALFDHEIEECHSYQLNRLGSPSFVDLHRSCRQLVVGFGMPEDAQPLECQSYGTKIGMISIVRGFEVIQIGEVE